MQINFGRLGGQLGVLLCLIGFVLMCLGWNGAASYNSLPAQFPYLISGGVIGLAVVVVGAAMLIVQNHRVDRVRLEAAIDRLAVAVEKQGLGGPGAQGPGFSGYVVAGAASYHRVDCQLSEARDEAELIGIEEAIDRNLAPCRVCAPPRVAIPARQG
ncbi:hypothetical protein [Streptomyces sp. V1I1]|jgi:hypothetical protein|uniref:hypothetical protein n=1 Tax=Streptomyces sp. V1I1 TaxID=3042272 RepID=UPI00278A7DD2|nr:hypothetical protein [Streptomyces sp. V1I1]MDQ0939719.1 hypothetical protein [Streptomyces sp. V1I1]